MPIYEFRCEICGEIFEVLQKIEEDFPNCPKCNSSYVMKLPSLFGFQDKSAKIRERERAILKRARDYLIDGKVKDARKFLEKAKDFYPTEKIKKLHETLTERKPIKGGYICKTELIVTKKKEK